MMICDTTGWGGPVIDDYCDLCKSYMIMTQKTPYVPTPPPPSYHKFVQGVIRDVRFYKRLR